VAGPNDERRLLEDRRVRPGHYAVIGYPKFDAARRLAGGRPRLFDNDRPTVLFNPHSKRSLRSWEKFARPLIDHAVRTGEFNLIVAPHAKLFGRRQRSEWKRWESLAVPGRVIVDLGSGRSSDMTYTEAADIYAGDVSSQVYEFLSSPKPIVFLNAHGIAWRGNRDFPNWDLGDVVEDPRAAIEAIRNAADRHQLYADRQRKRMHAVVDPTPGAAARGADAVLSFMRSEARTAPRIMILISDLGTGGTARATLYLANGLAGLGYDVSLLVTDRGGRLTAGLDARVKLIELDARRGRGAAMLLGVRQIAGWIRSERPELLLSAGNHMHVATTLAHAFSRTRARLALKLTNPVVRPNGGSIVNGLRRRFYKSAFGRAERVLTITSAAKQELARAYPAAAGKLRVVDNPYITDAMLAGDGAHDFIRGRLLAIGRLVEQKNYPLMLQALAQIADLHWTLDVLGDGPQKQVLEHLAAGLGIAERVNFHGYIADPLPFLAQAHALVLSSAWEGQGAVLLEALACGCPVIATRSTEAVADVLDDGHFGKLVPPGDSEALAGAIASELRNRAELPPETRPWVERYRIDAGVRSHVEALGLTED
jgi:glycosyltransferase involved in cell wall biosynthesis